MKGSLDSSDRVEQSATSDQKCWEFQFYRVKQSKKIVVEVLARHHFPIIAQYSGLLACSKLN